MKARQAVHKKPMDFILEVGNARVLEELLLGVL